MNKEKNEDLFLRSLDGELTTEESSLLQQAMAANFDLWKKASDFNKVRKMLLRNENQSFGPFFAEQVANHINVFQSVLEHQLFSFFKRYKLAAIGLIIALLTLNVIFSDSMSPQSILGFEEESAEIVKIDLYQNLIE